MVFRGEPRIETIFSPARRLALAAFCAPIVAAPIVAAAIIAAALTPARAETARLPLAIEARQEEAGRETRLIFKLDACPAAETYVLEKPARAIVDLAEVNFQIDPAVGLKPPEKKHRRRAHRPAEAKAEFKTEFKTGLIASFRFGRLAPGKSRIVVDLDEPAEVVSTACAEAPDKSFELVLALAPQSEPAFKAAARAGAEKQARAAAPAPNQTASLPAPVTQKPAEKPIIVLDPGHGGVDTGALGHNHVIEKFVVLDFAKALGAKLKDSGRYKVVYTREDDTFVPLSQRVRLARDLGAELFVSLHADTLAGDGSAVHGATIYTVSDRASDAEAARVAESENKADAAGGVEVKEESSDVNDILFDLTRRETRAYSHVFAHSLAEYWKVAARLNKNPQRSAGFVVLKAPDVPSALLELGYLSNNADVADLTSPVWREKAAAQAARAIEAFFASRQPEKSQAAPVGAALKATQSNGN
jgi:N-acetylmuramoyl-L-alanine amidase